MSMFTSHRSTKDLNVYFCTRRASYLSFCASWCSRAGDMHRQIFASVIGASLCRNTILNLCHITNVFDSTPGPRWSHSKACEIACDSRKKKKTTNRSYNSKNWITLFPHLFWNRWKSTMQWNENNFWPEISTFDPYTRDTLSTGELSHKIQAKSSTRKLNHKL